MPCSRSRDRADARGARDDDRRRAGRGRRASLRASSQPVSPGRLMSSRTIDGRRAGSRSMASSAELGDRRPGGRVRRGSARRSSPAPRRPRRGGSDRQSSDRLRRRRSRLGEPNDAGRSRRRRSTTSDRPRRPRVAQRSRAAGSSWSPYARPETLTLTASPERTSVGGGVRGREAPHLGGPAARCRSRSRLEHRETPISGAATRNRSRSAQGTSRVLRSPARAPDSRHPARSR